MLLKTVGGVYFKEDSQQNHRPSLCAIIAVSTLQTGSLILALTLSAVCLYFVIFSLYILTKVSSWCMYATVFECVCAFISQIVNIRFE